MEYSLANKLCFKVIKMNAECRIGWSQLSGILTLLRMGEGQKAPPISFSPVTSTNVKLPQNFLTFSFNPFDRLV